MFCFVGFAYGVGSNVLGVFLCIRFLWHSGGDDSSGLGSMLLGFVVSWLVRLIVNLWENCIDIILGRLCVCRF